MVAMLIGSHIGGRSIRVGYDDHMSDLQPGFQDHSILKSNISKTLRVRTNNVNRKLYTIYRMVPCFVTLTDQ